MMYIQSHEFTSAFLPELVIRTPVSGKGIKGKEKEEEKGVRQ